MLTTESSYLSNSSNRYHSTAPLQQEHQQSMMGLFNSSKKPAKDAQSGSTANATRTRKTPQQLAREKELERQAALSKLEPGALYILLFYRSTKDNDFHWGLYHHINSNVGGWKYHITGAHKCWYADHGPTTGALASEALVGVFRLKNIGDSQEMANAVRRMVSAEDDKLGQIDPLTCRIFVGRACERLKANGIITFSNWNEVQSEVFAFGNFAMRNFVYLEAPKPRPVGQSTLIA